MGEDRVGESVLDVVDVETRATPRGMRVEVYRCARMARVMNLMMTQMIVCPYALVLSSAAPRRAPLLSVAILPPTFLSLSLSANASNCIARIYVNIGSRLTSLMPSLLNCNVLTPYM